MQWAVLKITDGTTSIDLLGGAFRLKEWFPAIAEPKGGGVWRDSPLSDGRSLVHRKFGNVIETFNLAVSADSQDLLIRATQDLRRLHEQAVNYWIAQVPAAGPVWIEARAQGETNSRYAYVYDYRTPNDGDPYGAEFNPPSAPPVAFTKWPLLLERGHWQSSQPGTVPSLNVSGTNRYAGYIYDTPLMLNHSFETAGGGGADVFANWTETAGDGAIAQEGAIAYHLTKSAKLTAGPTFNTTLQQNVAVVAGEVYCFSVWMRASDVSYTPRYDLLDMTHGGTTIVSHTGAIVAANEWLFSSDVFIVPVGCVSLGIVLRCPAGNGKIAYFDQVYLAKVVTSYNFGRTATTTPEVFLANHSQLSYLTDVYYYDASAGTTSSNLLRAALPCNLFPNPVAVGDILYIGTHTGAQYNGPFSSVVFDLKQAGPAGNNLGGVWEYWNGAAWTQIPTLNDNTGYPLSASGVCSIAFEPPSNWAVTNGGASGNVNGWWIRFRVTAVSGAPVPQQQNRNPYTVGWGMAWATGSDIGGDLPALAKAILRGNGYSTSASPNFKTVLLFTRSVSRGLEFNPFINLSDTGKKNSQGYNALASTLSWTSTTRSSTGRALLYSPAGAGSDEFRMWIYRNTCNYYFGTFRAFARVKQTGGTAGNFSVALSVIAGSTVTGQAAYTRSTNYELMDLGQFTIPSVPMEIGESMDYLWFNLKLANSNAAPGTLTLYDLVLIPVDECAAVFQSTGDPLYDKLYTLVLDSIVPKSQIRGIRYDAANGQMQNVTFTKIAAGPLALQPNGGDQYVGVLVLDEPYPHMTSWIQMFHMDRYLSMRGDR